MVTSPHLEQFNEKCRNSQCNRENRSEKIKENGSPKVSLLISQAYSAGLEKAFSPIWSRLVYLPSQLNKVTRLTYLLLLFIERKREGGMPGHSDLGSRERRMVFNENSGMPKNFSPSQLFPASLLFSFVDQLLTGKRRHIKNQ